MSKAINRHLPLAAILVVGAVARLCGINFGLPHLNTRPDEGGIAAIVGGIYQGHFNPGTFNYPALFMLTIAVVSGRTSLVHRDHSWP